MVILASTRIVTQRLITPRVLQGFRVEPKRMPGKLHFFYGTSSGQIFNGFPMPEYNTLTLDRFFLFIIYTC